MDALETEAAERVALLPQGWLPSSIYGNNHYLGLVSAPSLGRLLSDPAHLLKSLPPVTSAGAQQAPVVAELISIITIYGQYS